MQKWQEVVLTAALGALIPAVGGLIWLGKLENRVEQLETQIHSFRASNPIDPVRAKCADLANQASKPGSIDGVESSRINMAMTSLGCFRLSYVYPIDISHPNAHILLMNAHSKIPHTASLFRSNRSQALRIPKDMEYPDGVKKVTVHKVGDTITIKPAVNFWDDFFARGPNPDFPERFPQGEYEERESFDV